MRMATRTWLLSVCAFLCCGMTLAAAAPRDIFVETLTDDSDVVANCVKTTQDGGFVATGYTGVGGSGKYAFVGKFDSEGNSVWPAIRVHAQPDSEGRSVIETSAGDFLIVGVTEGDGTGKDWLVLKYSSSGSLTWARTWAGAGDDEIHDVIETSDHSFWVVGFSNTFTPSHNEVVLAEVAADGSSFEGVRAGNPALSRDLYGYSLAEVFDTDGICVAGRVTGPAIGEDILLAKFGHDGSFKWAYRIGDSNSDKEETATSLVRTSDACLALAGEWSWWDGIYMEDGGFLLKTDSGAQVDWGRSAGGYLWFAKTVRSVIETSDGGLVVAGGYDSDVSSSEILLAKWTLGGSSLWTTGFGDSWSVPVGCSVAEDVDRSLLVAGTTYSGGTGDAVLARACCTGLTCLGPVDGADFTSWTPDQVSISPSTTLIAPTSLSSLSSLHKFPPTVTPVCEATTYVVCPDGSGDFLAIQDGIDAAANGDVIELCDGEFTGARNHDLDFQGKCLTVRSQSGDRDACVINCQNAGRGFYFGAGEECDSIVDGITIINGTADRGGGIYCTSASPTIVDCAIVDCSATEFGGGVHCEDGAVMIAYTEILNCLADNTGGGIYTSLGSPTIDHCTIAGCGWVGDGGVYFESGSPTIGWCTVTGNDGDGIYLSLCDPVIEHCTVAGNSGYGIAFHFSDSTIQNSILWDNCGGATWQTGSSITCECCDVEGGGCSGSNNINDDPLFCSPQPCASAPTGRQLSPDPGLAVCAG